MTETTSANWEWIEHHHWKKAPIRWQQFASKWRNVEEEALHPQSARVLELGSHIPGMVSLTHLYIRKCYEESVQLVQQWGKVTPVSGVIFTGQPGSGKTVFLWYLLICLLQAKEVVLLHAPGTESLLFYHDAVYSAPRETSANYLPTPNLSPDSTSCPVIWSLFDLGPGERHPAAATSLECFPVQTPSPNEKGYKHWAKERTPTFTGFPSWTYEELAVCASHNHMILEFKKRLKAVVTSWPIVPEPEALAHPGIFQFLKATHGQAAFKSDEQAFEILLKALILRFGPFPRDIFFAIRNFTSQDTSHENALSIARFNGFTELARELEASMRFPHTNSPNYIIAVHASGVGMATTWKVTFKSAYIKNQVLAQPYTESDAASRELIGLLSNMP